MIDEELVALETALERLRETRDDLGDRHAGVATLHLEATIAALESHLRRRRERRAA